MTYQTPCSAPENEPNDWFISRDGKQYADDELVDSAILDALVDEFDTQADFDAAVASLETQALKEALRRRRHAKDKCFADCLVRTQCLEVALSEDHGHGTWGGYYEEELREIRREISRRKRRNANK